MDPFGSSFTAQRSDDTKLHHQTSSVSSLLSPTVTECGNAALRFGEGMGTTSLASLTSSSSPSVVKDLINIHLSITEAHALLSKTTTVGGIVSTKPLDLSVDGAPTLKTHSLLGASISSGHGVPNSSADAIQNSMNHLTSLHCSPENSASISPSVPMSLHYSTLFAGDGPTDSRQTPFLGSPTNTATTNATISAVPVPAQTNEHIKRDPGHLHHHHHHLHHNNSHAGYTCKWDLCGQSFVELESLVTHVNERHVVLVESEYSCKWDGCSRKGKGFNARYKMLIHVRTHTNEKPHQCPICNKCFSRLENLKIHNRSHTGERPYVCPVAGCNKRYSNSSDRFKHTRTHLEEKPYFCKIAGCDKRYTDPSSLRKHVKTFGHYASRDHLNHYLSQKPSQQPVARSASHTAPTSSSSTMPSSSSSSSIAKQMPSTPIFPTVTQSPPTSNMTGLPEGVIVYPILVHSPTLQPHYSYVTLPGHLSELVGTAAVSTSFSGLHNNTTTTTATTTNNDMRSATIDENALNNQAAFGLNQDCFRTRAGNADLKDKTLARS